jgi:hypothetical protein
VAPASARTAAISFGFTGTLRIGAQVGVLRLLAAGFVVASVLGILWVPNARSGMTALGHEDSFRWLGLSGRYMFD